jgi:uncharacterized protein DUF2169
VARLVKATALAGVAVSSIVWRSGRTRFVTAVVKQTFSFAGAAMKRVEPLAVVERDDGPHAHELAPRLAAVDVLVGGHACAPQGKPAARLRAGLEIRRGTDVVLSKSLEIAAPPGGAVFAARLPLGPIARPRLAAEPLVLPDPIDAVAFQAAPADQRLARLFGDERIVLSGMDPATERIEAALPSPAAHALLSGPGLPFEGRAVALVPDMLVLDVDRRLCSIVWRGAERIEELPDQYELLGSLEPFPGAQSPGATIPLADADIEVVLEHTDPATRRRPTAPDPGLRTFTMAEDDVVRARETEATPFRGAAPPPGPSFLPHDPRSTGTLADDDVVTVRGVAPERVSPAAPAPVAPAPLASAPLASTPLAPPPLAPARPPRAPGLGADFLGAERVPLTAAGDDLPPP